MAATIIQRIISAVADNAIQLINGGQFARPVTLPAGWSKIRVGIRYHIGTSGANLTSTPRFAIGFGHGVSNIVGDLNCTNWIGAIFNTATWTLSGAQYTTPNSGLVAATKVGTTLSLGGAINPANSAYLNNGALSATADRTLFFVDVSTGSPNYTVQAFFRTNVPSPDVSIATYLAQMLNQPPVQTGHILGTAVAIAFSESPGALNAIQIWWDRSDCVFEICDVGVRALA